uniref:G protein-coupled receptor n=1 Tax=Steinernema glaseri TaxID=37863 RepID=A0A1I8AJH6_9BILA
MADEDIVTAHLERYGPWRYVTIGITAATTPLNALAVYLIVFKSPKCLRMYKYILLNIMFWVVLTDMIVDILTLYQTRLEIFGVYATGLAGSLGPESGFACLALSTFCIIQYLVALLFAFVYRLYALSSGLSIFDIELKKWHCCTGAILLLVVPSGLLMISMYFSYYPQDAFHQYTVAPLTLFTIPLCSNMVGILLYPERMDGKYTSHIVVLMIVFYIDAVVLTELAFSLHSAVNALAVIMLITPYKTAVRKMINVVHAPSVICKAGFSTEYQRTLYLKVVSASRMTDLDAVATHLERYELWRYVTIGITVAATPLNVLAIYLIVFKSPKHLKAYKYILLNIMVWVFLTDMIVDILSLYQTKLEISGAYAIGLARSLGPEGGFACYVLCMLCIIEYLVALLLAFLYRLYALSFDFSFFGKKLSKWHYCATIIALLVIPSVMTITFTIPVYYPHSDYKEYVRSVHPELLSFFDEVPMFGIHKNSFIILCTQIFLWIALWTICVVICIRRILTQFSTLRFAFSDYTRRQHVQLMKALVVQTVAPLALFAIPLGIDMAGIVLYPEKMDGPVVLTEVAFSLHSAVNALAVIVFIAPYRSAVRKMINVVYTPTVTSVVILPAIELTPAN